MDWLGQDELAQVDCIGSGRMEVGGMVWPGQNGLAQAEWVGSDKMDRLGQDGLANQPSRPGH